jgi:hypothetical protein
MSAGRFPGGRAFEREGLHERTRRTVHAKILTEPVVASVMAMITSGNAADADVDRGRPRENGGDVLV